MSLWICKSKLTPSDLRLPKSTMHQSFAQYMTQYHQGEITDAISADMIFEIWLYHVIEPSWSLSRVHLTGYVSIQSYKLNFNLPL